MELYDDPVLVTLCGGGSAEENPIAFSLSQAS